MSFGNTSRSSDTPRPSSMKSNTIGSNTYRPAFTRLLGASARGGFSTNRVIRPPSIATTPNADGSSTGHSDRADPGAFAMGLDEPVEIDRVDDVPVVDRERPATVPLHVLDRTGRPERLRFLDHADLDAEVMGPEELPHPLEAVVDCDQDFLARGRQRIQRVDNRRAIHEGDERFRAVQREGAEARAEAARDDHELHPRYEAGAKLSIFWPRRSLGDNRDDVVPPEDDGADPPDVVLFRLFRVLEDHVHVVVISDELPFEDPVVLEQELDPLVDGFF